MVQLEMGEPAERLSPLAGGIHHIRAASPKLVKRRAFLPRGSLLALTEQRLQYGALFVHRLRTERL